jgi:hypothetical protein
MYRFLRIAPVTVLILAAFVAARPLHSQVSRADSAAVLLEATRRLELEGETDAARDLLDLIIRHFPGTQAATEAETRLSTSQTRQSERSGRASLIAFSTLYGAWLGVAFPAAFGAEEPEPFGAGLLIGAPLGFFGAKAFVNKFPMSSGQATLTGFGARWGTWQGVGWTEALNIGRRTVRNCYDGYGCDTWEEDSEEAPFAGAIVGGLAGLISAGIVAQKINPTHGSATMVELGSWWGVWYGVAGAVLANVEEDDADLTWALMGGNLGLATSAIASQYWKMGAGRARIISAAGIAGGVAGLGLDLLLDVDDEETAVLIPTITSALGLIAGSFMTQRFDSGRPSPNERSIGPGLVNVHSGDWHLGFPAPQPASLVRPNRRSGTKTSIGVKLSLFSAEF